MSKSSKPRTTHVSAAAKIRSRRRSPRWPWVVGGLVMLAIIAGVIFLRRGNIDQASAAAVDSNGQIIGLQKFTDLARDHQIGALTYPQMPPVGGTHNPVW